MQGIEVNPLKRYQTWLFGKLSSNFVCLQSSSAIVSLEESDGSEVACGDAIRLLLAEFFLALLLGGEPEWLYPGRPCLVT
jgi:hypothetical protein